MARSTRRLIILVASIPLLVVALALAYQAGMAQLEGKPRDFWHAVEWAAETLTTTGYGHDASWQHPLMVLFVTLVQFTGVFLVFLVFPIYLIPFLEERFEARLPRRLRPLAQHVVVFRWGPAVVTLVQELRRNRVPYVIIESSEEEARRLVDAGEPVLCRQLDDGALEAASMLQARALIANGSDSENAAAILTARHIGFAGDILGLVEEPMYRRPMQLAGASGVFTPRHVLAAALADRASDRVSPRVAGSQNLGEHLEVVELRVRPHSELAGRSLAEARVAARTGATVIGQWVEGQLRPQPVAATPLEPSSIIVAVGRSASLKALAELAGHAAEPPGSGPIVILGYGEVGRKVAELLSDVGDATVVVERLAGPGVDVVGDALDASVLKQARVAAARAVVLSLDSDAATLFATVILRDLSERLPIIARVNQAENVHRIHRAGASFALSISQISGQILARRLLGKDIVSISPQLRVMRAPVSALIGRRLAELDIRGRTGCSVVVVERGDDALTQFGPDFRFEAGDKVYICGSDAATSQFSDRFAAS